MTIKTILISIFLIFLFIFYIIFKDKIAYLHANLINNLVNVTNTAESTIKEFDNSIFLIRVLNSKTYFSYAILRLV